MWNYVLDYIKIIRKCENWYRIERRQVVFLCRLRDSNPGSQAPNLQQAECRLTNLLSYRRSSLTLELNSPSLHCMISEHSAHSTPLPIWLHSCLWRYSCLLELILMHWQQERDIESKGDKLSSPAECRNWTQGLWNRISSRLNIGWQTDWAIDDQAKIHNPDNWWLLCC